MAWNSVTSVLQGSCQISGDVIITNPQGFKEENNLLAVDSIYVHTDTHVKVLKQRVHRCFPEPKIIYCSHAKEASPGMWWE